MASNTYKPWNGCVYVLQHGDSTQAFITIKGLKQHWRRYNMPPASKPKNSIQEHLRQLSAGRANQPAKDVMITKMWLTGSHVIVDSALSNLTNGEVFEAIVKEEKLP